MPGATAFSAAQPQNPPRLGLVGMAGKREAERICPRRVRWLYEALVGRSRARLASKQGDDGVAAAVEDAQAAIALCGLASDGWYRLREAMWASGNRAAAHSAEVALERLGYSLEADEEGQSGANTVPAKRYDPWGRLIL